VLVEALVSFRSGRVRSSVAVAIYALFLAAISLVVERTVTESAQTATILDGGISLVAEVSAVRGPLDALSFEDTFRDLEGVRGVVVARGVIDVFAPGVSAERFPLLRISGDVGVLGVPECDKSLPTAVATPGFGPPPGVTVFSQGEGISVAGMRPTSPWLEDSGIAVVTNCERPATRSAADEPARMLIVMEETSDVVPITHGLRSLLATFGDHVVISSSDLVEFRDQANVELGRQRQTRVRLSVIALVVVLGVFRTSVALLSRSEHGRRRVLGASRMQIAAIGVVENAIAIFVAVVVIATVHTILDIGGELANATLLPSFVLVVVASTVAQLPSLALAGFVDPVKALRVP
jgi:hypothetical protein